LRKYAVVEPPTPVEYLLVAEGVVVELVEYADETAGECWWDGETGHVAAARGLSVPRLRFTLAHELGHLALRHHQRRFGDLSDVHGVLRDSEPGFWTTHDLLELEANRFAAELLMPTGMFTAEWSRSPYPRRLASQFEVSMQAVQRRIGELGLVRT
jgi:Zn-dependent peptidase ImmA (M78 family)